MLRLRVDGRLQIDLHPRLSVVVGLEAGQAATLRRSVSAVAAGLAPPAGGLLEAEGLLLDATQPDLDLLDLGAQPVPAVLTTATLSSQGGGEALERLRAVERDALLLATDRRWAARALEAARQAGGPEPGELVRAEQLRLEIAAHEATDVEPLRRAVDADRDARLVLGGEAPVDHLLAALGDLGLDLRGHTVAEDEVRAVAQDVLEEHLRQATWVVGARVELDGLERRLLGRLAPASVTGAATAALLPESGERRVGRARSAQWDAIARADEQRDAVLAATAEPPADPADLADRVLALAAERRRPPPVGAVPLVLDRVLAGLADDQVERLLDQLVEGAGGVQLVVLDDHPAAVAWARRASSTRAAVVGPSPARAAPEAPTMRRS